MSDDANPQGIQRPRLAFKQVYQDDPKTSRPVVSIHSKKARRQAVGTDIHGNKYGSTEGNDPQGIKRPNLPTKTNAPGKPYDQNLDPDY